MLIDENLDGLNGIQFKYEDQVKAHFITYETLCESEEEQILGKYVLI